MKIRNLDKEKLELLGLGLTPVDVKCGTFYPVPRVVHFYKTQYLKLKSELETAQKIIKRCEEEAKGYGEDLEGWQIENIIDNKITC